MNSQDDLIIRQAREEDLKDLALLEKSVYGGIGTACYHEDHFRTWFEVFPEGLLVAQHRQRLVGYQYSQLIDFAFDRVHLLGNYNQATDDGYTRRTHDPDGNSVHCITICSILPGAGRALSERVFDLAGTLGKAYTIGLLRIPGFDSYMKKLESGKEVLLDTISQSTVAVWYALENARIVGGTVWPSVTERPTLDLPPLEKPDPVIGKQLKFSGFGIAAVFSGCMQDPQSRDHAVLLVRAMKSP